MEFVQILFGHVTYECCPNLSKVMLLGSGVLTRAEPPGPVHFQPPGPVHFQHMALTTDRGRQGRGRARSLNEYC